VRRRGKRGINKSSFGGSWVIEEGEEVRPRCPRLRDTDKLFGKNLLNLPVKINGRRSRIMAAGGDDNMFVAEGFIALGKWRFGIRIVIKLRGENSDAEKKANAVSNSWGN